MSRLAVVLTSAILLGLPSGLAAQRREARTGVWFDVGLGAGWGHVGCYICRSDRPSGLSGHLRLGGGVSKRVLIGGEAAMWRHRTSSVHQTLAALSAAAYWYPTPRTPLYLKGGLGWVTHRAEDGTNVITSTGFGPQMGIGYELPVGRTLYFAPYFNAIFGVVGGSVKFNGGDVTSSPRVTLIQLGVALTAR